MLFNCTYFIISFLKIQVNTLKYPIEAKIMIYLNNTSNNNL